MVQDDPAVVLVAQEVEEDNFSQQSTVNSQEGDRFYIQGDRFLSFY